MKTFREFLKWGVTVVGSTHETCLQEFIVILKRMLENYNKFLKTCFMGSDQSLQIVHGSLADHVTRQHKRL